MKKHATFYGVPIWYNEETNEIEDVNCFWGLLFKIVLRFHIGLTGLVAILCSIFGIEYTGFFKIKIKDIEGV